MGASAVPDKNSDSFLGRAVIVRASALVDMRKDSGLTVIEMVIVTFVIAIIIAAGSSYFSSDIALRRSVDDITANVATTLQLTKLQAARSGVEFRAVFAVCDTYDDTDPDCLFCDNDYVDFVDGDEEINIIIERGDSNRGSTNWCIQSEQLKEFQSDLDFVTSGNMSAGPVAISFLPAGFRSDFRDDNLSEFLSLEPISGAPVDKCGLVEITPVGGIRVIHGRWDGTTCNAILDPAPTPGPS